MSAPVIQFRDIAELIPYARNSNKHPPSQIAKLRASYREFGVTNPVLVDESGGVVAGHGRLLAAGEEYAAGGVLHLPNGDPIPRNQFPVLSCAGWSDAKRRAYIIADNKLGHESVLDDELVALEMQALQADGFDLSLTGFDETEIGELFAEFGSGGDGGDGSGDPEAIPPAPEEPISRRGDIWVCGTHRIGCMDSLSVPDWVRLMDGEMADLCVTDPPYNVAYVGKTKDAMTIANDSMSASAFREFLLGAYQAMFAVMKPGAPIYVAHADTEGLAFRSAFIEAGFKLSGCLIWRKNVMVLGRSDYQWQHEPVLYGWKPGAAHKWYGGRKRTTVIEYGEGGPIRRLEDGRWAITVGDDVLVVSGDAELEQHPGSVLFHEKPSRSELHPTTKPVGLWERFMKPSSRAGDVVIDSFSGSGTTILAAERLGLRARVSELDPKFVDVAVMRWQDYTGQRAVHAETGEFFPASAADRQPLVRVEPEITEAF